MELSKSVVNKLRCSQCKAYLSCAPVFLKTNRQSICGRCSSPMMDRIRNEPYEKLAHQMKFPCRYDKYGCQEILLFANTKAHETFCKFRLYKCTVSPDKCTWWGAPNHFYKHCQTEHKNDIVQNPHVLTHVTNDIIQTVFLTACNTLFMLQFKVCYVTKTLQHFVCLIGYPVVTSLYKYDLRIENNAGLRIFKTCEVEQTNIEKKTASVIDLQSVLVEDIPDISITFSISAANADIQETTTANVRCELCRRMNELPVKIKKHEMFFCNNAAVCQLCNQAITGHSYAMHYKEAHTAEKYNAEMMFRINVNSSWYWCIIQANFGRALCKYRLDENGFTMLVYTSLPGHMLHMYNCEVIIIHTTDVRKLVHTANRKYQCTEDWYLHVPNEEVSLCIVNSKVDIQINFTEPEN